MSGQLNGLVLALAAVIGVGCSNDPPPNTARSVSTHPASSGAVKAPSEATGASSGAVKAPGEATVGDRTLCMISNEEFVVTASSPKVEHQGKTYYFCCKGCDTDFKKDPEKYLRKNP